MTTTTIHAPWMNFVRMKTQSTTNVATAPSALMKIDFFQCVGAVTSSVTNGDSRSASTANSASGNGRTFAVAAASGALLLRCAPGAGAVDGVCPCGLLVGPIALRGSLRSFSQCLTIPDCE